MSAVYDPVRLVADVEVHLHQLGVQTVAGGAASAVAAACQLLRALSVEPVDERGSVQYRVLVAEQKGVASDECHAENFAHALRMSCAAVRAGRAIVLVEAVPAPVLTPAAM